MSNKRIRLLADKLPNYPKTDNTKGKLQITNFTLVIDDKEENKENSNNNA